eukprot:CAMPEP_0204569090 /NCGR_PEP_ID=MMETSP0661-20131031/37552_1 /ASSEMBLY_ACC=CAM_ASM_000606 /TAXON_ID=109239 /ORGANISM="Alexandrium margalefi, Strain AMGDE01CS-322" /LENGTH=152 /DNA_ID=CAMNT_0051577165 /DNA_START=90 /DNA_END=548 /DNA_ORIENTATION=-
MNGAYWTAGGASAALPSRQPVGLALEGSAVRLWLLPRSGLADHFLLQRRQEAEDLRARPKVRLLLDLLELYLLLRQHARHDGAMDEVHDVAHGLQLLLWRAREGENADHAVQEGRAGHDAIVARVVLLPEPGLQHEAAASNGETRTATNLQE